VDYLIQKLWNIAKSLMLNAIAAKEMRYSDISHVVCIYTHARARARTYVCMYVCMHARSHIHTRARTITYIHTYIHIYIYTYIYIYICIYMLCVYINVSKLLVTCCYTTGCNYIVRFLYTDYPGQFIESCLPFNISIWPLTHIAQEGAKGKNANII